MPEIVVGSSDWWLAVLGRRLDQRMSRLIKLTDYYAGRHALAFASDKFRLAFGGLFGDFAINYSSLVVDALEERIAVEGFRIGNEKQGDNDAWDIWQANGLDAASSIAHREALIKGEANILVWPEEGRPPRITIEDALQTTVAVVHGDLRARRAALKRWTDEYGYVRANLYFPDRVEKYRSASPVTVVDALSGPRWERYYERGETWPLENPLGAVPMVSLINQRRLDGTGESELTPIIPLQNILNKIEADMIVASEYGAFRQRWATGIQIPVDPETGKPVEVFKPAIDRVWHASSKDAKFGEFEQTDLAPYVAAIEATIQSIASISRTPPHYLLGQSGNFPSGESLKATETGLVAKAHDRMRTFGEAWEEVIRLSFIALEDERGEIANSETIWRDPESRSESEHIDALMKLKSLGIPNEILWEKAGFSPQEIERINAIWDRVGGMPTPPVEDESA